MTKLILTLLLLLTSDLFTMEVTFDIRSSQSEMQLTPDSLVIFNKSNNTSFTFVSTNKVELDAITSVKNNFSMLNSIQKINIYSYDGRLHKTFENINKSNESIFNEINSLENGIYFVEYVSNQVESNRRDIILIDGYNHNFNYNYTLNFLINPIFNVKIYKHGYKNKELYDVSFADGETLEVLLDPEYDKYFNQTKIRINGIVKYGKTSGETDYGGKLSYSTYDSFNEYRDSIIIENTELRILDNDCLKKVMEKNYRPSLCNVDFPIAPDSAYFCGLKCNSGSYLSSFSSSSMYAIFNKAKDTLVNLTLNYKDGTYENGGYPSFQEKDNQLFLYIKELPIKEESDKFVAILNRSDIQKHLSAFRWDIYYYAVSMSPPFFYNKSNTSLNGEMVINSDAQIIIEIYKSK